MDLATIDILADANRLFYDTHGPSFSETRKSYWQGWDRMSEELAPTMPENGIAVLDVACGNMRLARFFSERFGEGRLSYTGIDACTELAETDRGFECKTIRNDVIGSLKSGEGLASAVGNERFDCVCCFGFMHHVPGEEMRMSLLQDMAAHVKAGGWMAVSFWCFERDRRLKEQARAVTDKAASRLGLKSLDEGDWFLGWKGDDTVPRYCHSFTEKELERLCSFLSAETPCDGMVRYSADGKTGNLNEYVLARASL